MTTRRTNALRQAQDFTGSMARQYEIATHQGFGPAVRRAATTGELELPSAAIHAAGGPDSEGALTLYSVAVNSLVYHLWSTRSRSVYAPDPAFITDMTAATRDTDIDWSVLTRLSTPNPAVVFPEPYPFTNPNTGQPCRLYGFYAFGRDDDNVLCATDDPRMTKMAVVAMMDADPDARRATIWAQAVFPLSGRIPLGEHLGQALRNFRPHQDVRVEDQAALMDEAMRPVFAALLYLCCEDRDEEAVTSLPLAVSPTGSRKGSGRTSKPRMARVRALGWRISDAMRQARRARQEGRVSERGEAGASGRGGWTQPPHMRSMHVRRVRYGKGRENTRYQLILPYQVGVSLEEGGFRLVR